LNFEHFFQGGNKVECQLGLTPRGVLLIKDKERRNIFPW